MTFIPPAIFALAITVAMFVIWKTLRSALPAIRSLKNEWRDALRVEKEPAREASRISVRPRKVHRPRRRLQPKPITHRLHHFTQEIATRRRACGHA